jgi:signal transduction histidine kinase
MPLNNLALFVLIAVVIFLVLLTIFILLRLVSSARRMSRAEQGSGTAYMAAAMQEAVSRMREHERHLAARAEASELLSDQVFDSLPSGLLVTDASGMPQRINPAGAGMLGVPEAAGDTVVSPSGTPPTARGLVGLWDTLGESGASLRSIIDECLATGAGSSRRTLIIDGRHLGASVSPLRDSRGTVTGAICLFADLTAVVDLENQLRLKDSLSRLGELTAGLAHEFRNGLATIHGYARLMDPDKLPADHRAYVESLRAETDSLTEIVSNFLTFAKPAQQLQLRFPLAPIVNRAADEAGAEAARHQGHVTVKGTFDDVEGDDVMMRQALSNLLRNAIEAAVEAGLPPRVRIAGSVDRAAGVQRVTVSDSGPGVPPDIRDKVFRPFFTTRGRGTGLGLALVQKIVVSHNGRITLGSSPEGGAEFAITLPLAPRRN